MKILIHGGLNLSIMDGWWREGYNGVNGWAIGDDASGDDWVKQDEIRRREPVRNSGGRARSGILRPR